MALSQSQSFKSLYYILLLKSFLIWAFTLAVCLLIVGFPLIILMVTIGALATVVLQSLMPISSVLVVAGSILGFNLFSILLGAAALTLKGIHPQDVSWLGWLNGDADSRQSSVYASCPLTCAVASH
ncbi:MAG TPA: hypothetical protein V6D18_19875 [Thermosynechococcaceae cyanobacterium]